MKLSRRAFGALSLSVPWIGAVGASELPRTLRMGVSARPRSLDPRQATDALSSRVNRLLYRALVDFDDRFQPVPDLAEWQQQGQVWRFILREPLARFHTGEAVTAQDVAATFRSILDPATASPLRGSLAHIRTVSAEGARVVRFELSRPDPLFAGRLNIGILPRALLVRGHDFNRTPVGCGPCQLVGSDEQQTVLRRPDGVRLAFVKVKDPLVRVLKLRKGELDLVQGGLAPELTAYCARRPELAVDWHPGTSFAYIGFNFRDSLLSRLPVRRAIAHAIDREAIVRHLFQDHARLAGGLLVPEHWAGLPHWQGYAHDPDKAHWLLRQVAVPSPLRLSYKTSAAPLRVRLAAIYQDQLRKAGIRLDVRSYDWGTFYGDIKAGRFQLYSLAWVGVKSPDIFQYVFHSGFVPPKGANRGHYVDAQVDALIEQALRTNDPEAQAALYRRLQQRLAETVAMIPLWYEDQYVVRRADLHGYRLYADGRYDGLLQVV